MCALDYMFYCSYRCRPHHTTRGRGAQQDKKEHIVKIGKKICFNSLFKKVSFIMTLQGTHKLLFSFQGEQYNQMKCLLHFIMRTKNTFSIVELIVGITTISSCFQFCRCLMGRKIICRHIFHVSFIVIKLLADTHAKKMEHLCKERWQSNIRNSTIFSSLYIPSLTG